LPPRDEGVAELRAEGIVIRRANTFELTPISDFIRTNFSQGWADENAAVFGQKPVNSFIAIEDGNVVGFATVESVRRGFFGPTGVAQSHRGRGIGKALLIAGLWGLADMGYAYAIIGAAGPVKFYQKTVNASLIPDSVPGVYTDLVKRS
jgi:predicted N-acetyltransferase YhbS